MANRSLPVNLISAGSVSSFRPRFRTVSIMPGIETAAPLRTDTSSGLLPCPKVLPVSFSSFRMQASTCLSSPAGYLRPRL